MDIRGSLQNLAWQMHDMGRRPMPARRPASLGRIAGILAGLTALVAVVMGAVAVAKYLA